MQGPSGITGFKILEKLGESLHAQVFKVLRVDQPNRPLVLKKIKPMIGSGDMISFLQQQILYYSNFHLPYAIIPTLHQQGQDIVLLVQEYFDSMNLGDWRKHQKKGPLHDFFSIACSLAAIIDDLHRAGHIHGGIKPNNILIAPETLDLRLIDLIRVFDISRMSHFINDDDFRRNTLSYISPEQTGRIGQQVDYTSDLYSLGIVLYELLSGSPPFFSSDPLEVIYSHLAEHPSNLLEKDPNIPGTVVDIIFKLLHKEPERRYQTGKGLLHDLERCREEFLKRGSIPRFSLGLRDTGSRISLPSIMIGREKEKKLLLNEYAQCCSGSFRAAFISGLPGIGKTRLIQELQAPIVAGRGYFTSGKYDQYQKDIPYSSLLQATRNLIRMFLTEDTQRIQYWKEVFTGSLVSNARLIIDLVPELELIIGPQPEVPSLPPTQARDLFNSVVQNFASCLARQGHPVTFFIDDLQWCDTGTFNFLYNLFATAEDHPYFFFLGAYRHNEVDASHPLNHILQKVRKTEQPLLEIRLERFNKSESNQLVSHILDTPLSRTETLSEIIDATSEGNPLYIREALSWLHEDRVISMGQDGTWQWDEAGLVSSRIPDAVVDLFANKVKRLPKKTLKLIQTGACFGSGFGAEELSLVSETDMEVVLKDLSPAFQQRILVRGRKDISFFHDRIQEAVYGTLGNDKRRAIHARIAEVLIQAVPEGAALESLDNLFQITDHMNRCRGPSPPKEVFHRDALFNYHAGKKAVNALALQAANRHFKTSRDLLPPDSWDTDYELTFSLFRQLARSELTLGNQKESEAILNILIERSKTDQDRAECLAEQTTNLCSLGLIERATETGNRCLAYFDRAIPDNDAEALRKCTIFGKEIFKDGRDVPGQIMNLSPVQDRESKIELAVYADFVPNFFLTGRVSQVYLAALQATLCCLKGGIDESALYAFAAIAHHLQLKHDYEGSFKYEDLVRTLAKRQPNTFGTARGMNGMLFATVHNRNGPQSIILLCAENIRSGKTCGDMLSASLSYTPMIWSMIIESSDLVQTRDHAMECLEFSKKFNIHFGTWIAEGILAGWWEIMNTGREPVSTKEKMQLWKDHRQMTAVGGYLTLKGVSLYYLGSYSEALAALQEANSYKHGMIGLVISRLWCVFSVLTQLRLSMSMKSADEKGRCLSQIDPFIERVETWCGIGPILRPYLTLIHAERTRITEDFKAARNAYLDAVDVAHDHGYTLLEGHIHECLAEMLAEQGNNQARFHIMESGDLYEKCRAEQKGMLLRKKYPQYFQPEESKGLINVPPFQNLDIAHIIRASRTIAQELDLEELLKIILRLIMEGLGAQKGYLLTMDNGSLTVRAEGIKGKNLRVALKEEPLTEAVKVSKGIIYYVQRTKTPVVLANAMEEGPFSSDKEVRDLKLRSVLCWPLMKGKKLVGMIYLQNDLITSVFTEEQVELARILTAYGAIALENAVLVDEIKGTEITLRESNERLQQEISLRDRVEGDLKRITGMVFETMVDGITIADMNGRIKDINNATVEQFGYTREEAVGKLAAEIFIAHKDLPKYHKELKDLLSGKPIKSSEFFVRHKSGREFPVSTNLSVTHDSSGEPVEIIGVHRDISEQKEAQEKLQKAKDELEERVKERTIELKVTNEMLQEDIARRKQVEEEREKLNAELVEKNRELEQMVYVTSHDLRSPLVNIEGFSKELGFSVEEIAMVLEGEDMPKPLRDRLNGVIRGRIAESLQYIDTSISKIDSLLMGLLRVARIGRAPLDIRPLNMNNLVSQVLETFEFQIKDAGVSIQKGDLPWCKGDERQINQVFSNLLDNALKYMDPKRPGTIRISGEQQDDHVVYSIEDNGIGISKAHQKKIFEMFHRLDPHRGEGEGLGLTTVQRILSKNRGAVRVESQPGKGSTFLVTLPSNQEYEKEDVI